MTTKPTFHDTATGVQASLDVEKKHDPSFMPYARSDPVYSNDSTNTLPEYKAYDSVNACYPVLNFTPGNSLTINSRGMRWMRLPVPSSELEIEISNSVDNSLAYTSTRAKKRSGDAVLSHPTLGELISTTYRFGPNREPEIRLLQGSGQDFLTDGKEALKIKGQWTSRAISFTDVSNGRVFEWRYVKTKNPAGEKVQFLALMLKNGTHGQDKMIAQLRRDESTRTFGTRKSTAGNGGQLVLDKEAASCIDEALVVATCIMMLKKEIDRRRCAQFAILAAMSSGGN